MMLKNQHKKYYYVYHRATTVFVEREHEVDFEIERDNTACFSCSSDDTNVNASSNTSLMVDQISIACSPLKFDDGLEVRIYHLSKQT